MQLDALYNPGLSKQEMQKAKQIERERRRRKKAKKKLRNKQKDESDTVGEIEESDQLPTRLCSRSRV